MTKLHDSGILQLHTEGMPGYRDYRFHFIGFLKGLGFCAVGALLIAVLWMVAQGLTT